MKKKNIVNLVKYHSENNDYSFNNEVYEIAADLERNGDEQTAEYLISLVSDAISFSPQVYEDLTDVLKKVEIKQEGLWLPKTISDEILGITNAVSHNAGINKFLFEGKPGTGKTEAVKQLARILNRILYMVDFNNIIDSKLGETQKNIAKLFDEIKNFTMRKKIIVLFDEIDAIALDRMNSNDIREMGRATSMLLKEFDNINEEVVIVATTNLYQNLDKALVRRFDFIVNFDRYEREDMISVANNLLNSILEKFKIKNNEKKLAKKIFEEMDLNITPGELKNIIKTVVAFSNPNDQNDYIRRLYTTLLKKDIPSVKELSNKGYTLKEIECLSQVPKSTVSRELKNNE